MLIAIDFDGTLTACHGSWFSTLPHFVAHGHSLVTVTSRRKSLENQREIECVMREVLGETWPIVFAYDQPKRMAARAAGFDPDIWIDDQPWTIGTGGESLDVVSVFENELRHAHKVLTNGDLRMDEFAELVERLETVLGTDAP